MKTPLTTHRSLPLVLALAFALTLAFLGTAQAGNPLEELQEIFTKDRSGPPSKEPVTNPSINREPPIPQAPTIKNTPGVTACRAARLISVTLLNNGNILYRVGGYHSKSHMSTTIQRSRLAGNIETPLGQAIFQLLLTNSHTDDTSVTAKYPSPYDCQGTNLAKLPISLTVRRGQFP